MTTTAHERQYLDILRGCYEYGEHYADRTGVGRQGLWQRTMRFELQHGFPLLTTKYVPFKSVVRELLWFISGSTYEPHLAERGAHFWKPWAPEDGHLGPIYGHRMRNAGASPCLASESRSEPEWDNAGRRWIAPGRDFDGVDQLRQLVEGIIRNPNSTRLMMNLWDEHEAHEAALPPCHIIFQCKVSNGYLHTCLYQRSCDQPIGVPFNIASYALLTELLAHVTGLRAGTFVHHLGDVHIYDNQHEGVREQLSREPHPSPTVRIEDTHRARGMDGLLEITEQDITLHDYYHHPKIEYPVAV